MTEEGRRLEESRHRESPWKKWGPYLSERQWGTVREDYSETGNAWDYFSHDQARSRAYRWGEDGLAGISDDKQILCFALALWNGVDPIIKERVFGLTNSEGNHGEDVKDYYPQTAFPYDHLVVTNRRRNRYELEYELIDTGIFDADRYFDVFVEYAKAAPEDILVRVTVANRGPEAATVHVLPTLWFRNTWSWGGETSKLGLRRLEGPHGVSVVAASHAELGEHYLYCGGEPALLFTENDTNTERIFRRPNGSPWVKDAIDRYLVQGQKGAVNPAQLGTKVAAHYPMAVAAGATAEIRLRLSSRSRACRPRRSDVSSSRCSAHGSRRPIGSTPRSRRPRSTPTARWSCARRSPACCGASSSTTMTSVRGSRSTASTRIPRGGRGSATGSGRT
jgi:hypothetical protein